MSHGGSGKKVAACRRIRLLESIDYLVGGARRSKGLGRSPSALSTQGHAGQAQHKGVRIPVRALVPMEGGK